MIIPPRRLALGLLSVVLVAVGTANAQGRPPRDTVLAARRDSLERELQRIAVVERKVMVPMRDGVRMQFDVYRPKNASGPVPAIFVRTPYNMNFWDVNLGAPADMTSQIEAVQARVRVRRRQRARPFLLRGQLRHPRPAAHGRHR